jgi:ribosomal protein S18 acetylase RimI-like enzyme
VGAGAHRVRAPEEVTMSWILRDMRRADIPAVERIHRLHVGSGDLRSERRMLVDFIARKDASAVALVAIEGARRVVAYVIGEVRAFEFGSPPAGWIFAIGVEPKSERRGLGRALRQAAIRRFSELGVKTVRTMVKKDDVRVLRFFRDAGFHAGPYVELELAEERP